MAQTNQSDKSTYKQTRIDFIGAVHNRDSAASKDQRFVNVYPETTKVPTAKEPKKYLVKRPGLSLNSTVVGAGATARGCTYWEGNLYTVFGDKLYKGTSSIQTLATSTGTVGWAESSGVTKYLFICDGTDAYVVETSGTVTKVNQTYSAWAATTDYSVNDIRIPTTDNGFYYKVTADTGSSGGTEPTWPTILTSTVVDGGITWTTTGNYGGFPTPHVPKPIFMDGYIFLIDSSTSDIYNSDLENPLGWSAANFISAEMWPDDSLCLTRQNNQIVVLGKDSTEFLYDTGGTSGTPLGRNDAAAMEIGIAGRDTVYQDEKQFLFVGQSNTGGRAVWKVEGFQAKKISYEGIERILDAEGTSITSAIAIGLRTAGHYFYLLNLTSRTLVYDIEEQMWHEWSTNSSNTHSRLVYNYATDSLTGKAVMQHNTNGKTYLLDPAIYQDDGVSIISELWTSKLDFGTINRKFMFSFSIVGDTTTSSSILAFRWSDDDYKTWSSWKDIDLIVRPYFTRLGVFRRRAFNFKHTGNAPLRLEAMEVDINMGNN